MLSWQLEAPTGEFFPLPAGSYKLVIEHHGFEHVEKDVELPAGKRGAIEIPLAPVTLVAVTGGVAVEGHGGALAGARVTLTPVAVPAAVQGLYDFRTAWDGTFKVIEMPPGKYRVDVAAAGCIQKTFELEVKPGLPEVKWQLPRDVCPAQLTVTLRDSATGKAVAGAKVTLAEAGSRGKIAEAKSGADGTAVFKNLKIGRLNWEDADANLLSHAALLQCLPRRRVTKLPWPTPRSTNNLAPPCR